jgi:hypothetical protein
MMVVAYLMVVVYLAGFDPGSAVRTFHVSLNVDRVGSSAQRAMGAQPGVYPGKRVLK